MAILSNIFGGNEDGSSSQDSNLSTDTVGDLTSAVGLNVDSSQSNYNQDEDGNVSAQQNDNSLDFDTSTDGLLGNVTDAFSSSDETTS
jgi:hypothetical protein